MNVFLFLYTDAESGETKVELNKVSTSIPFYGVPDLAEVLGTGSTGFVIETCLRQEFCSKFCSVCVFIVFNFYFIIELACQKDSGVSNSLSSCRPFKVIHYLQVLYFVRD